MEPIEKGPSRPALVNAIITAENAVERVLRFLIIVLALILFAAVFLGVADRYAYVPFRTIWTSEIARFFFVWTTVMGAALSIKDNRLIRIGLLVNKLPFQAQRAIAIFGNLVIIATSVVMAIGIFQLLPRVHVQTAPASKLRMSFVYFSGLAGAVLFAFFSVGRAIRWMTYASDDDVLPRDK